MHFSSSRSSFLLLALTVMIAAPAAALEVSPATKAATLTIGDILFVTRDGLTPDRLYRAIVTDEDGFVIADVEVKPDPHGIFDPAPVWIATGVVGCDELAEPDPRAYRFARFEEAEDVLKGRTFLLTLLDDASQASIARIPLSLEATEENLVFFSDAGGCPRSLYSPGEPVFMTGMRVTLDVFWMFLIEAGEEPLEVGDPLKDVRESPRMIRPPSSYFTEPVTDFLVAGILYDGTLEPGEPQPNTHLPNNVTLGPKRCISFDDDDEEMKPCSKERGIELGKEVDD